MIFHTVNKYSQNDPEKVLCNWLATENDRYRVTRSLTHKHWLAFFRTGEGDETFSLIDKPVETRKKAEELCREHSLNLPW